MNKDNYQQGISGNIKVFNVQYMVLAPIDWVGWFY